MRIRITVRGPDWELRGYTDNPAQVGEFSDAMEPYGLVVASIAEDDYDPFQDWT